jgi:hypothetical protein
LLFLDPNFSGILEHQSNTQFLQHISTSAISFAAWRLPNVDSFNVVASNQSVVITDIAQIADIDSGFVISPFDIDKHQIVFIPAHYEKIGLEVKGGYQPKHIPIIKSDEVFHLSTQSEYLEQAD